MDKTLTYIIKPSVSIISGAVTFVESVDLGLRVLAFLVSVVVGYWAIKSYRARYLLDTEKRKQLQTPKQQNENS